MESSRPMDIMNKLRRGSMDSNMDRRDSMESGSSVQDRSASFEAGKSFDEARLKAFKENRAKKMWVQPDPSTAFYSA